MIERRFSLLGGFILFAVAVAGAMTIAPERKKERIPRNPYALIDLGLEDADEGQRMATMNWG